MVATAGAAPAAATAASRPVPAPFAAFTAAVHVLAAPLATLGCRRSRGPQARVLHDADARRSRQRRGGTRSALRAPAEPGAATQGRDAADRRGIGWRGCRALRHRRLILIFMERTRR